VNILPGMRTIYRWRGRIETGGETVMIVKTTHALVDSVRAHVRANHPYECPCIAALPVTAGDPAYLAWIAQSVSAPRADG
jgi:periplasmic divalent cation tolerance protein